MYILVELFSHIDLVCTEGILRAKESAFYKLMCKLVEHESEKPVYGIPYYILFDNTEFIDIIVHDYILPTISYIHNHNIIIYTYDATSQCFVFFSMQNIFDGMVDIFKKILEKYPQDVEIMNKLQRVELFLSMVKTFMDMDGLCDNLSTTIIT